MRMGFRPLVNMTMPIGLNNNPNSIFSPATTRPFLNPFLNPNPFATDNHHVHQPISEDHIDDKDDPDLHVELENKQLWDSFHAHGTEMVKIYLPTLKTAL